MKLKILKVCLIVISCLFCVALFAVSIWAIVRNGIDYIGIMSGISSVVLSLLTALYVYTTSKQIDVVNKQIEEMKMDRITKEQPLLSVIEDKFIIERPNFYYAPPFKEYSIQSRYHYNLKLKNISNSSAALIDLEAKILVKVGDKIKSFSACNERINTLAANTISNELSFMFVGDNDTIFYNALREPSAIDLPVLRLSLIYKNLCGGYFKIQSYSTLAPQEDNENVIKAWQKTIVSAKSDSKEVVQVMSKMDAHDEKRNAIFRDVQETIKKETGEIEEIEVRVRPIDEGYSIKLISKEDYEKEMSTHSYPHFVHKGMNCVQDEIN